MNLIVNICKNYAIGKDGKLLFHIPEDMRRFKDMTMGKTVIMGSGTLRSLPAGKPLKGRRNIVLSRSGFRAEGVSTADSVEALASLIDEGEESFVIGGEAIYRELLPYCEYAYITLVEAEPEADRFFPNIDEAEGWVLESESPKMQHEGVTFSYRTYRNTRVKRVEVHTPCGYLTEYAKL